MISLAMIVRNEAPRLGGALASVKEAVDEIVVVDTGSTDDTRAVAKKYGAQVIDWSWRDDFGAARNESIQHCTGQWVLILDADERLAAGAVRIVRECAASGDAEGYDCRLVSTLPAGQPTPTVASWFCRLFRRDPGVRFDGRIHEQVAPSIRAAGGRIVRSGIVIDHGGYATPSPQKLARNLALLGRELDERPDDAFMRFHLGLTLHSAGDHGAAAEALGRAVVSERRPLARDLRAVAWSTLAQIHLLRRDWVAAAEAAGRALAAEPTLALARYARGRALFERGEYGAAAEAFRSLRGTAADALGVTLAPRLSALGLGLCLLRLRRYAEAADALSPVLADDPSGEIALNLGNAFLGLRLPGEAATMYRTARARGIAEAEVAARLALCERVTGGGERARPDLAAKVGR
jgi:hypothetical protein